MDTARKRKSIDTKIQPKRKSQTFCLDSKTTANMVVSLVQTNPLTAQETWPLKLQLHEKHQSEASI